MMGLVAVTPSSGQWWQSRSSGTMRAMRFSTDSLSRRGRRAEEWVTDDR